MRNLSVLCIFLTLLAGLCLQGLVLPSAGAAPAPVRTMPMPQPKALVGSAESLYSEAKGMFTQLEQDASLGSNRENWLAAVRQFRKVQLMRKSEDLTAASRFMQGRLYRQMYERFRVPLDLDNAIDSFYDVAASYPKSLLADDALYLAAEASLLHPTKKEQASELLRKVTQSYAGGDQAQLAADLLKRLHEPTEKAAAASRMNGVLSQSGASETSRIPAEKEGRSVAARSLAPAQAQPTRARAANIQEQATVNPPASSTTQQAQIEPVKYWSSDDYTRIVIPATAAVSFTSTLLEKRGSQPRRLVVDFNQSVLAANAQPPLSIEDGLLKQVRTGQYAAGTVRVVLDIESLSDYKVFSLPDPFRVIIDVHGVKSPRSTSAVATAKPVQEGKPAEAVSTKTKPGEVLPSQSSSLVEPQGEVVALQGQKKTPVLASTRTKSGKPEPISLAQQLGLGVRHIVIDPGHGGKDPGAIAFGLKEKDVVLQLSRLVAKKLNDQYGYEVSLTRNKDRFLSLEERTAIANTKKADLFLSLHVNAHPDKRVGGVETYYLNLASDADAMRVAALENATSTHSIGELQDILQDLLKNAKIDESSRLAQFIHRNLARGLKQDYQIKNLGVKQAPFYVLIGAEMPAVLMEVSFITNPAEAKLLQSESYLDKIATEIVNGLISYVQHHHSAALQY